MSINPTNKSSELTSSDILPISSHTSDVPTENMSEYITICGIPYNKNLIYNAKITRSWFTRWTNKYIISFDYNHATAPSTMDYFTSLPMTPSVKLSRYIWMYADIDACTKAKLDLNDITDNT